MLKLGKTKRAIAMAAATLAIAGGATITATGSASAASGGGCRAWFDIPGHDVRVAPCISASGSGISGNGYLNGSEHVDDFTVQLMNKNTNQAVWQWGYGCPQGPAANCDVAPNFGSYPSGAYYVAVFLDIAGTWYGPVDSPVLYI
ncbi:hypothetical protein ACFC8N_35825 [Streptomyces sp. NPDC055966]|uniref:hypothetical protein n=1 Tax=unclassified Streptomyces TaxID=2593676 RepID=UPI0035D9DE07